MNDLIVFMSNCNKGKDTVYYHQEIVAHDKSNFIDAIINEFNNYTERKHWKIVDRSSILKDTKVLPLVWSMKPKRSIATKKVTKYKARLNMYGGKQEQGINFFDMYAPIVTGPIIPLFLTLSILQIWHNYQISFSLAYSQTPIEVPMYTNLPPDIDLVSGKDKVLQLHCNIYR